MDKPKDELEVLNTHIDELQKLQEEYSEKIKLLTSQLSDFNILVESLTKQADSLKNVDMDKVTNLT